MSSNLERRRDDGLDVMRVTSVRDVLSTSYVEQQEQLTMRDKRLDHRRESRHVARMREIEREAREGMGEQVAHAAIRAAAIEARRRYFDKAKKELQMARMESQMRAGDDLELTAKFAQMDDDLYRFARMLGLD